MFYPNAERGWEKYRRDFEKYKKNEKERFRKIMANIDKYNEREQEIFKTIMKDIRNYNEELYKEMTNPETPKSRQVYLWFWYFMTRI